MKIHALGLVSSQFRNVSYTAFVSGQLGLQCELSLARSDQVQLGSACSTACSVNEALVIHHKHNW
jgi:hypothetical protein